jgi:hypothetical protein
VEEERMNIITLRTGGLDATGIGALSPDQVS